MATSGRNTSEQGSDGAAGRQIAVDTDGDGRPDAFDTDGDGAVDTRQS
jgi:hypothetical protein